MADTGVDVDGADGDTDGALVGAPAISSPRKLLIEWLIPDG